MRKIIHVIDGLNTGGAQAILLALCKYKNKYEHSIVALSGTNEYAGQIDLYADVRILSNSKYNWIKILYNLFRLVIQNRVSIFNGHLEGSSIMLAIIRLFIKFKLILTIHAIPSQLPFWYTKIYPILCKLSEYYIVEDRVAIKYLVKNRISSERIKHIKIGVENHDEIQKVKDIKKEFGIPKDSVVLLNISRMIPQKGQKDLILMMKELIKQRPEMKFHLIIVGYGQEEERLKKLTQNLDLESIISFAGKRIDIGNFYACSDWFLMPCYDESMGVVIYDALIHNIPVIAYNNGSVSEAIDSERKGYLVNPHYMEMVNVLIENYPPKRIKLSKDEIYQYSAERMADEYEYIYGKLE